MKIEYATLIEMKLISVDKLATLGTCFDVDSE